MWLVGIDGTHIVLCEDMAQLLRARYASAAKIIVLSNAVFTRTEAPVARRAEIRVVGFLGNISPEKGIFEFIEVMKQLAIKEPHSSVRGLIAGKFDTPQIEETVQRALITCANVKYVGPKYGAEKVRFLTDIDVLLFPSKYRNEAEPLTILEAMSYGSPVIASDRGCIKALVSADSGLLVENMATFVSDATEKLSVWIKNPGLFQQISATTLAKFSASTSAAEASLQKVFEVIEGTGMNRPETFVHGHLDTDGER
jgi:glycosyltransferase involved in cell wall biosynthesis